MDMKGNLRDLLNSFPFELNLKEHFIGKKKMTKANKVESTWYDICGIVSQDPIFLDYTVHMKNKKRENAKYDWFVYNKRGIEKLSDDTQISEFVSCNAQIVMYQQRGQDWWLIQRSIL